MAVIIMDDRSYLSMFVYQGGQLIPVVDACLGTFVFVRCPQSPSLFYIATLDTVSGSQPNHRWFSNSSVYQISLTRLGSISGMVFQSLSKGAARWRRSHQEVTFLTNRPVRLEPGSGSKHTCPHNPYYYRYKGEMQSVRLTQTTSNRCEILSCE